MGGEEARTTDAGPPAPWETRQAFLRMRRTLGVNPDTLLVRAALFVLSPQLTLASHAQKLLRVQLQRVPSQQLQSVRAKFSRTTALRMLDGAVLAALARRGENGQENENCPSSVLLRLLVAEPLPFYLRAQQVLSRTAWGPVAAATATAALPPPPLPLSHVPPNVELGVLPANKRRRTTEPGQATGDRAVAAPLPVTVYEVDEHHEVLASASLTAALRDSACGVLVNFDSHDDLGVPPADAALSGRASAVLRGAVDVGTWIMPLAAAGALRAVIWVTAHADIPKGAFDARLLRHSGTGQVTVTGRQVSKTWRALWGEAYSAGASVADSPQLSAWPLRLVVCDSAQAAQVIAREAARLPANIPYFLSMDLDFFSTRNPALRSLPFSEHPSFARALWRLARAVPITSGDAFHAALLRLYDVGPEGGEEELEGVVKALHAAARGTRAEARPSLDEVTTTAHAAVERFAELSQRQMEGAFDALMRAHLADHQSTADEIAVLQTHFEEAARQVMRQPGAVREVLLARSEMYLNRRQAVDIRAEALRIIHAL